MRKLQAFSGMPGVEGVLKGTFFRTIPEALQNMQKYRITASAGDNGSVTVYRDDEGRLQAYFRRYLQTVDHSTIRDEEHLKEWLEKWFPECWSMTTKD